MKPNLPLIAVDLRDAAGQRAGKGNVAYYLMEELLKRDLPWRFDLYSKQTIEDLRVDPPHRFRSIEGRSGFRMLWLANEIKRSGAMLSVFPTGYQIAALMALQRQPYILIVHDLVAFTRFRRLVRTGTRLAEQFLLPFAARHAAGIVTVSTFTKQELLKTIRGLDETKIHVMHLAAHPRFLNQQPTAGLVKLCRKYELPDQFVLFIGTLEPRKNIEGMLSAYHRLPQGLKGQFPFVLVGKVGWLAEDFDTLRTRLAPGDPIRHITYIGDQELPGFYQLASVFLYPSFYEGFGLPPLEAMASGCPVLVSNAGSLPEVVGEAGLTVDPNSPPEMSHALETILEDAELRSRLGRRGRTRARAFTWTKAGDIFAKVVSDVIG